jgi:hypothetical protein
MELNPGSTQHCNEWWSHRGGAWKPCLHLVLDGAYVEADMYIKIHQLPHFQQACSFTIGKLHLNFFNSACKKQQEVQNFI